MNSSQINSNSPCHDPGANPFRFQWKRAQLLSLPNRINTLFPLRYYKFLKNNFPTFHNIITRARFRLFWQVCVFPRTSSVSISILFNGIFLNYHLFVFGVSKVDGKLTYWRFRHVYWKSFWENSWDKIFNSITCQNWEKCLCQFSGNLFVSFADFIVRTSLKGYLMRP